MKNMCTHPVTLDTSKQTVYIAISNLQSHSLTIRKYSSQCCVKLFKLNNAWEQCLYLLLVCNIKTLVWQTLQLLLLVLPRQPR